MINKLIEKLNKSEEIIKGIIKEKSFYHKTKDYYEGELSQIIETRRFIKLLMENRNESKS